MKLRTHLPMYWIATILLCGQMAFASLAYLTRAPAALQAFAILGYPEYFVTLLGVGKIAGLVVLLVPRLPLAKEWAYAGFTLTFVGAILSHIIRDESGAAAVPAVALGILMLSYFTRPASRRLLVLPADSVIERTSADDRSPAQTKAARPA